MSELFIHVPATSLILFPTNFSSLCHLHPQSQSPLISDSVVFSSHDTLSGPPGSKCWGNYSIIQGIQFLSLWKVSLVLFKVWYLKIILPSFQVINFHKVCLVPTITGSRSFSIDFVIPISFYCPKFNFLSQLEFLFLFLCRFSKFTFIFF